MTEAAGPIRIEAGAVLIVGQADYCHGTGELRIRVPCGGVVPQGAEWLPLTGAEVGSDGKPRGERHAVVRVAALANALKAGREWESERVPRAHPTSGSPR